MVSGSLSDAEGNEHQTAHCPFSTYTEQFYDVFHYYLATGMTYEQFWDGDPSLVKYYRKADQLRQERKNQELWIQGMYIYEALCDVSPVLRAFAKDGTKPIPYRITPYALDEKQAERKREENERAIAEKGKQRIAAFMARQNKMTE